jgi:hypothetical protein
MFHFKIGFSEEAELTLSLSLSLYIYIYIYAMSYKRSEHQLDGTAISDDK